MRVHKGDAQAAVNILENEILDQCGFAGAGPADEIHMLPAIGVRDGRWPVPEEIRAKVCELVVPVHSSKTSP